MGFFKFWITVILFTEFEPETVKASNPDGSCTNPKFRWFKTERAFHHYADKGTNIATRVDISMDTKARCLDGSPYMFYFRPGFGEGTDNFHIYFQGGGWCTSLHGCKRRASKNGYIGSSKGYTDYAWYSSDYLDDNEANNPLMYNWNSIWMIYCDGASFLGNDMTVHTHKGMDLYFRGYQNLKEGMNKLYNDYGMKDASNIALSGCSAGGLTVYLHSEYILDNWVNEKAAKTFLSIPDFGFFPKENPVHESSWGEEMLWIYETQNVTGSLHPDCLKYYVDKPSNCMFSQYVIPFLKRNKFYALQSIYDTAGLSFMKIDENDEKMMNEYGQWFANLFIDSYVIKTSDGAKRIHGGLLHSCKSHCGEYNHINVNK